MSIPYRPLLEVLREALHTLEREPGPMTPEKSDLLQYIRARIALLTDPRPLGHAPK